MEQPCATQASDNRIGEGPLRGGSSDLVLGDAEDVGVEAAQCGDERLVAGRRAVLRGDGGVAFVLQRAVHPPPLDLQPRGLGDVERLVTAPGDKGVEPAHAAPGRVGPVVRKRRPVLVRAQH